MVKTKPLSHITVNVQPSGNPAAAHRTRAVFTRTGASSNGRLGLTVATRSYPVNRCYLTPASTARLERLLRTYSQHTTAILSQDHIDLTIWPPLPAKQGA